MKTYFLLAWRNLWRNKRRTLIASASIFFAVIFALLMRSMQEGSYDYMVDASVSMYTGYIQVHAKDYWDKRSIDKSMELSQTRIGKIDSVKHVTLVTPRLESFSLISYGNVTKVASIVGIDPGLENEMTDLKNKLISGKYLTKESRGLMIAEGLAELLKVGIGDSVVLYGQGYHGVTAAAQVEVEGIVKFTLPALNKTMVYLSLDYSQWLYAAPNRVTTLSIMIDEANKINEVHLAVSNLFDEKYEVMMWPELMPELVQSIEVDNAGGIIMLGILYVVIGFGIFGTVMMMTAERTKEFGILISVGMKKWRLSYVSFLESLFLSFIGVLAGIVVSIPILYYLKQNPIPLTGEMADAMLKFGLDPIVPFRFAANIFIDQFLTVLVIAMISALYPLSYIRKLNPIKAMRK
ncbi:MAG: FtsX-like permease family protein [Ignavibacteriaceae bacterium]|jgi:ABC-type lipoprotein release transport system permease subunit